MDYSTNIKSKRESLGLTQKDFADALGLGKYGDRTLRRWENKESKPSPLEYKAIMSFASNTPYIEHKNSYDFTFMLKNIQNFFYVKNI